MVKIQKHWQKFREKWPFDKVVVVTSLTIAAMVFLLVELSEEVLEGDTLYFDTGILRAFRDPSDPEKLIGPSGMFAAVHEISSLGGVSVIVLITALVSLFYALKKKWHMLFFFLMSVSGGTISMILLKSLFNRTRPMVVPPLTDVSLESYPSGHSMVSAIVYLTLGALLARSSSSMTMRMYYLGAACFLTLIIGLSRVILGVHYPSDVIAGWSAGIVWAGSSYLLAQLLQRIGVLEKPNFKDAADPADLAEDALSANGDNSSTGVQEYETRK